MKVPLSGFRSSGHILGFHPQTQKLELPCTVQTVLRENTAQ